MLHSFVTIHPLLYWPALLALLEVICRGWYYLGSTRVAPMAVRRRGNMRWSWSVSHRFFSWQFGAIAIAGRFDSSEGELAASVIVKLS